MSTKADEPKQFTRWQAGDAPKVLDRGRTVCNERNEKGKLCNGHLKQIRPVGEPAAEHLRGDDVLYKCQFCGALYTGPPLGHVRAPAQKRFVQKELIDILQAAGGTLPFFDQSQRWREPSPAADSSPAADRHRPAAEAQAATGHASAVPLSPAAATASPAAGAETPDELAPDAAPREVAPTSSSSET